MTTTASEHVGATGWTAINQALHAIADRAGGRLWLALDGTPRGEAATFFEYESLAKSVLRDAEVLHVPIDDRLVDRTWRPRWLQMNVERSFGSAMLQESLTLALDETQPTHLGEGRGRRVAGWIACDSDADARDGATRIAEHMIVRRPDGGRSLLRLHDPAVLWAVWLLLDESQRSILIGRRRTWWTLDPAGRLTALRATVQAPSTNLSISAAQWVEIEHIAAWNGALRQSSTALAATAEQLVAAHRSVMRALIRARGHGLVDIADLTLYATHALDLHPEFDLHPRLNRSLAERNGDESYRTLAASIDAASWPDARPIWR